MSEVKNPVKQCGTCGEWEVLSGSDDGACCFHGDVNRQDYCSLWWFVLSEEGRPEVNAQTEANKGKVRVALRRHVESHK